MLLPFISFPTNHFNNTMVPITAAPNANADLYTAQLPITHKHVPAQIPFRHTTQSCSKQNTLVLHPQKMHTSHTLRQHEVLAHMLLHPNKFQSTSTSAG
jgi:hypothetical protein